MSRRDAKWLEGCKTYKSYITNDLEVQGVHKLSLQFSKFIKILFLEIFSFDLFYSEEKCFKFFL